MNPRESLFYKKTKDAVLCLTCEKRCRIKPGATGQCKTRKNIDGKLFTLVYGDISSISANPIEKKPLFHFHPGTRALTVGTWSCNFTCPWCQNNDISKYPEFIGKGDPVSPEKFIRLMEKSKCRGTSISFNEPTLLLEYAADVFRLAGKKGYYNTIVTNGYMTPSALKHLADSGLGALNVDIKGDRDTVKKYCGADVEKVWRNVIEAKKLGLWVELTTLIIGSVNSSDDQVGQIARRISSDVGDETPWHVTAYHPAYEFRYEKYVPPTSAQLLERAVDIGKAAGLKYVYTGNVPGHRNENTYCPACGELLIERYILDIVKNRLSQSNRCPACGYEINIIM